MPAIVPAQQFFGGCSMVVVAGIAIAFVTWVANQVAAQNKGAARQPGQRPPRPRNDRIQQEIDKFIQEAAGRRPPRRDVVSADEIEIVSPPPRGRQPAPRRPAPSRPASAPSARPRPVAAPAPAQRPGQVASQRHLTGPDQLGTGLNEHVRTHMDNRVETQVQSYLPRSVDQEVSQHLGTFAAQTSGAGSASTGDTESRRSAVSASGLLQELRSPAGVRRAIMMREILERPLALRRTRR